MPAPFHRLPGTNVTYVGGPDSSPWILANLMRRLTWSVYAPRIPADLHPQLRAHLIQKHKTPIGGIAIKTAKGWRIYISNREIHTPGGATVHQLLAHERFHTLPLIGFSEILAHYIGGLRRRPGKLSWRYALYEVLRLATTRPYRFCIELLLLLAALIITITTFP